MLTLRFDGLYMGVPKKSCKNSSAGFMCYGWILYRGDQVIARGHGGYLRGREASSNVAEYLALIEGLEALRDLRAEKKPIRIIGDAKSVIEQMQGDAGVHSNQIRPLYQRAQRLARWFYHLQWEWVPRRGNKAADALTRRALRQIRANPANYSHALDAISPSAPGSKTARHFWPLLDLRVYQQAGGLL